MSARTLAGGYPPDAPPPPPPPPQPGQHQPHPWPGPRADRWGARAAHRATGAGLPCLVTLLLAPVLVPLALLRHRAPDQPDQPGRPDRHPDRRGAHEPAAGPFAGATLPAPELIRRLRDRTDSGDIDLRALATLFWALALGAVVAAVLL